MKTRYAILAMVILLAGAVGAWATPSTLIWIPSTDIQADRTWHLGIDSYFTPGNTGVAPIYDIGPEYGFGKGRAEAGIDYIAGFSSPLFFNAKYLLTPEKGSVPAVVAGAQFWGTKAGETDYDMLYVEGAKTVGPVRLTLGYCHGKESTLGRDPDMLLAGLDATLTKDKKWWGAIDFQSGKNAFGALNAGVSYACAANTSVIVGYDWYNDPALKDTVTTQLDVNF